MSSKSHRQIAFFCMLTSSLVFVAAIFYVGLSQNRNVPLSLDLYDAAERIQKAHPEWYLVGAYDNGDVGNGFYVCVQQHTRRHLKSLYRNSLLNPAWENIVFVETMSGVTSIDEGDTSAKPFFYCGNFLLYGDKNLAVEVSRSLSQ